tara:strand:- start:233 stop:421 length:189 start_codon:yes stop_codon:yes gene_type:complete
MMIAYSGLMGKGHWRIISTVEVKALIEEWRKEYNTVRPHRSLGYKPPAPEFIEPIPLFYATH